MIEPLSDAEFLSLVEQVLSTLTPEAQGDFLNYLTTLPRESDALQLYRWLESKEIH